MKPLEERIRNIRSELDDLESDIQDLWDEYIKVSNERDELEEKLRELGGNE